MRARVFLLVVATTLLAPAAASAKGPAGATVDGDGFDRPVELDLTECCELLEDLGFYATAFRSEPDRTLDSPPAGDLGPRLEVSWEMFGPSGTDIVRQDVYPLAPGGPVTYMAPGQPAMGSETYGGWFRAPVGVIADLEAAGVPTVVATTAPSPTAASPTAPSPTAPAGDGDRSAWWSPAALLLTVAGAAAVAGGAGLVVSRRRAVPRPA